MPPFLITTELVFKPDKVTVVPLIVTVEPFTVVLELNLSDVVITIESMVYPDIALSVNVFPPYILIAVPEE